MNYFEIGQRIRKFRKAGGLSQDQLAEKIGISITHMSHIETGNTKLSLPVLVSIAEALEVRTDDLLYDSARTGRVKLIEELASELEDCGTDELKALTDILKSAKISIKKYLKQEDST